MPAWDGINEYYLTDTSLCDDVLEYYFKNRDLQAPGKVLLESGNEVVSDLKNTTDVTCLIDDDFLNQNESIKKVLDFVWDKATSDYFEKFVKNYSYYKIHDGFNIQQYVAPGGHYNTWHCEHNYNAAWTSRRIAAWMIYLNTLDDGQTEFFHQDKSVYPEKGKLLIWPSFYTHIHRGSPVYKKDKFIMTGWIVCTENIITDGTHMFI